MCLFSPSFSFAQPFDSNQTGISGYVLESQSGKPIPDAEISCRAGKSPISTAADSNGFFVLTGLAAADFEQYINVIAKNFASRRVVITPVSNKIIDVTVELSPSSKVAGRITDENGNPDAGAAVEVFHLYNQSVKTDAQGFYEIDGLDPAFGYYQIKVKSENYPQATINFSPAPAGQTAKVDFVLKSGAVVYGQVTDPRGNPLSQASVGNTESRCMWNCVTSKTDANGFYELKNVDKGPLVLWAVHPQYPPYVDRFTIEPGENEKQINIQFENPKSFGSAMVTGKIPPDFIGKSGIILFTRRWNPIQIIENEKESYKKNWDSDNRITPDANGYFKFKNLKAGKYCLILSMQGIAATSPIFEIETSQVLNDIPLIPAQSKLRVLIFDAQKNTPIPGAACVLAGDLELFFRGSLISPDNRTFHTYADANGFVEYVKLPKGIYKFSVNIDGYLPKMIEGITIDTNNISSLEVSLEKSAIVNFILDEKTKGRISEPEVYLYCKAVNLASQKLYTLPFVHGSVKQIPVYLISKDNNPNEKSHLNLPPGKYLLEYELYQDEKGFMTYQQKKPLLTGRAEVSMAAGQTTDIIIKENE